MSDRVLKRRIAGWMLFDWASQPFYTSLWTFIFAPFFAITATQMFMAQGMTENAADAQAQSLWSAGQMITGLIIAFSAPFLGAIADSSGRRRPWIALFSILLFVGAWGTWFTVPDGSTIMLGLVMFSIGFIGAEFATIFTNSYLPSLGNHTQIGKISGNGFAIGYAGGFVALAVSLAVFAQTAAGTTFAGLQIPFGLNPDAMEGTRAVGPFVAIWFAIFMVPFFLWVHDEKTNGKSQEKTSVVADLKASLAKVIKSRSTSAYLLSAMFYRDALNALYAFGGTYAALVLNWSVPQIGAFGVIAVITAAIFTWLGGKLDTRFGPKPVIVVCVLLLIGVSAIIVGMSREQLFGITFAEGSSMPDNIFYLCGAINGAVGGILQSASRTMMVRHADPDRPTEAFGLYALSGKGTAFLAPALITAFTLMSGSVRHGFLPVIALFLIGLVLLIWVKPEGDRAAWSKSS